MFSVLKTVKSDTPTTLQAEVNRLASLQQKIRERKDTAIAVRLSAVQDLNADIVALKGINI